MGLLTELIAETEGRAVANPANVANLDPVPMPIFADSQDSQGLHPASAASPVVPMNTVEVRTRLLAATAVEHLDGELVQALPESELRATSEQLAVCEMTDRDDILRGYLHALADTATRKAGKAPVGDTARMLCAHCGPIWIHPSIAAVLPVVNGWPRALGCPWCHVKPRAGLAIPRPTVTCDTCRYYQPDKINPAAGCGRCQLNMPMKHGGYPQIERYCKAFNPTMATP